ncbi:MAG: hypothetical protein ACPGQR_08030 [Marinirhabdus sp.]
MTSENNNNVKTKILIGVLTALLIALGVYTVFLYNDSKENLNNIEVQKAQIEGELEELIANYDEIIKDNELKDKDLMAARARIKVLLDSIRGIEEANLVIIQRFNIEIDRLKRERKVLFKKADSLILANLRLTLQRDSANVVLKKTIKMVDSVNNKNKVMAKTIEVNAMISASNLSGNAVIVRKNGRIVDTRRSSRADKIRACFTLNANAGASEGEHIFYVQIFNPKNDILGKKGILEFENGILNYSDTSNVYYENESLDVCILVDAEEEDLIEGRYHLNLYDRGRKMAAAVLDLK